MSGRRLKEQCRHGDHYDGHRYSVNEWCPGGRRVVLKQMLWCVPHNQEWIKCDLPLTSCHLEDPPTHWREK